MKNWRLGRRIWTLMSYGMWRLLALLKSGDVLEAPGDSVISVDDPDYAAPR